MSTTLALALATVLVAIAAVSCGIPRFVWADDGRGALKEVTDADGKAARRLLGTAVALALLALLGFWDAPGAWAALALVSGVAAPFGLDRWRRTHGSASPLRKLLAQAPPTTAPAKPETTVKALVPLLRTLTDAQRTRLADAGDAEERFECICRELAAYALWTDRAGAIVWRDLREAARRRRDALQRLHRVPMAVLATAITRL